MILAGACRGEWRAPAQVLSQVAGEKLPPWGAPAVYVGSLNWLGHGGKLGHGALKAPLGAAEA